MEGRWRMSPPLPLCAAPTLVKAVAGAGDLDRAETLARSISDPDQQAEALTTLVEAVAGAGDLDRARDLANQAETLARSITDPHRQALALILIAEIGEMASVRRLLARALSGASWMVPLDLLAAVEPTSLLAIADDLISDAS